MKQTSAERVARAKHLYDEAERLHAEGKTSREIATLLSMERIYVLRWLMNQRSERREQKLAEIAKLNPNIGRTTSPPVVRPVKKLVVSRAERHARRENVQLEKRLAAMWRRIGQGAVLRTEDAGHISDDMRHAVVALRVERGDVIRLEDWDYLAEDVRREIMQEGAGQPWLW